MSIYKNVSTDELMSAVNAATSELNTHKKKLENFNDKYGFNTPVSQKIEDAINSILGKELNGSIGSLESKLGNLSSVCAKIDLLKNRESKLQAAKKRKRDAKNRGLPDDDDLIKQYNSKINYYNDEINNLEKEINGMLT